MKHSTSEPVINPQEETPAVWTCLQNDRSLTSLRHVSFMRLPHILAKCIYCILFCKNWHSRWQFWHSLCFCLNQHSFWSQNGRQCDSWASLAQTSAAVLAHFQGSANHVTTAHSVNTRLP